MAASASFDFKVNNFGLAKQQFDTNLTTALEAVGLQAEGYAKLLCRVDTGNLRNSITHTVADDGTKRAAFIGSAVFYAA